MLAGSDVDAGPGIVGVSPGIPELGRGYGLDGGGGVPGPGDDLGPAWRHVDHGMPVAPGPGASVLAQVSLVPGLAVVGGDVDTGDAGLMKWVR